MHLITRLTTLIAVAALAMAPSVASAAVITWQGGVSTDFTNSANWVGGTAPSIDDTARVVGGVPNDPTITGVYNINDDAAGAEIIHVDGGTLAVTGSLNMVGAGFTGGFKITEGSAGVTGTVGGTTGSGNMCIYGGTLDCGSGVSFMPGATSIYNINQTGGVFKTTSLVLGSSGILNYSMTGGLLDTGSVILGAGRQINFAGGTIIVDGDQTGNALGLVVAGTLVENYDGARTTIYLEGDCGCLWIEKFLDANDSGSRDVGENLLPGWSYRVTSPGGYDQTFATLNPNSEGNIGITDIIALQPGDYTITEFVPAGWSNTCIWENISSTGWTDTGSTNSYTMTIHAGVCYELMFGNVPEPASLAFLFFGSAAVILRRRRR